MGLSKAIRHLVEHVVRLGPVTGLRLLYLKKRGPGHEAVIRVPDLAGPLTIRTGTSDLAIFDEVVIDHGYRFPLDQEPQVIVDAGANIGMATLWFKARWPNAMVIAIEPDASNFALLERNLKGIPGVRTVLAALAPVDGILGFETVGIQPSAFHLRELRPAGPCRCPRGIATAMKGFKVETVHAKAVHRTPFHVGSFHHAFVINPHTQ